MRDRLNLRAIYALVELRLNEKFWDPELHPRVSAGTTKGGEFTFKGAGTYFDPLTNKIYHSKDDGTTDVAGPVLGATGEPYDPTVALSTKGYTVKLDPETLDVGGDAWNRHVARRLEYEYKRTKPDLDKLVDKIVGEKTEVEPQHPDDEDVDEDVHYTPESWDEMPGDMQETAEQKWKEDTYQGFLDAEIENWQSEYAPGEAGEQVAQEFTDGTETDWAKEALDTIRDYRERNSQSPIPFTNEQLLAAVTVSYDKDAWPSKKRLDIDIDDDKLEGEPTGYDPSPQFPGIEPQSISDYLTKDMRDDIIDALKSDFDSRKDHVLNYMEAPDYLSDSVSEYQDEHWDQMDDHQKFKWVKNNTDLLDDEELTPTPVEIVDIKRPAKIDPLGDDSKHGRKTTDYKMTQALARRMSIKRAAEIMKQRGIGGTEAEGWARTGEQIARDIDNRIWSDWKGSSTSKLGKILQMAIAEELHGRLNYAQLATPEDIKRGLISRIRKDADDEFPGGYDAVKAYLRAKWETTQWLLDNAGMQTLDLYRGLKNIKQGEKETMLDKRGVAYDHLPELDLERNGAASTSANRVIANKWGPTVMRMKVPRTSVLSVPVYGQNEYGEQETVVTGTAFKGWDTWASPAPSLDDVPIIKAAS